MPEGTAGIASAVDGYHGPATMDIEFLLDDKTVRCPEGLTVAAALLRLGRRANRTTPRLGAPRPPFCGMGICFDCVLVVDGRPGIRSCLEPVRPGMRVATQQGASRLRGSP